MNIAIDKIIKFETHKRVLSKYYAWFNEFKKFGFITYEAGIYQINGEGKPYGSSIPMEDFSKDMFEFIYDNGKYLVYEKPSVKVWFNDNSYPDIYRFNSDSDMFAFTNTIFRGGNFVSTNED